MADASVKAFLDYLNDPANKKNDLMNVEGPQKVSLQVCLHKIPNLINCKVHLCRLPHSINVNEHLPEVCLLVNDIDRTDRDYEATMRKYQDMVDKAGVGSIIKQIMPIKQLKLEFRPYEIKRKLACSFDMFLADKSLHEVLFNGSQLGKEFQKRRKMPIEIEINPETLRSTVEEIIHSTMIRLNGKGTMIDINAFLSSHSVPQAMENLEALRVEFMKVVPGGEPNIKSMFLKTTNSVAVPLFQAAASLNLNEVKVESNMTGQTAAKHRRKTVKRLKKDAIKDAKKKKKAEKTKVRKNKAAAKRELIKLSLADVEMKEDGVETPKKVKSAKVAKVAKPEATVAEKKKTKSINDLRSKKLIDKKRKTLAQKRLPAPAINDKRIKKLVGKH